MRESGQQPRPESRAVRRSAPVPLAAEAAARRLARIMSTLGGLYCPETGNDQAVCLAIRWGQGRADRSAR
jgi:hypothetical protein